MPVLSRIPPAWRPVAAILALGAALIGVAVGLTHAFSGSDSGGPRQFSRPSMITIFEAQTQLIADPEAAIAKLRRLGAGTVRVFVAWKTIAPGAQSLTRPQFDAADPAAYPAAQWAPYDAIVRDATRRGLGVDFDLAGPPPLWASGPGAPKRGADPEWRPSPVQFGMFVRAVGRRYNGNYKTAGSRRPLPRVHFWSVWNEPNLGPNLAPQAIEQSTIEVAPAIYRRLLDAGWRALHQSGHGRDTILIGELAPRGMTVGNSPGTFGVMVPLRFLRALYCVDASYRPLRGLPATERSCPATPTATAFRRAHPALFRASAFSVHPYPQGQAPDVPTFGEPDVADLPALPTVEAVLDRIQRVYGSAKRFDLYSTEYGYQTFPPEALARTTTPRLAAYYLNWAEYLSWRDPRIRSFDQYLLTDPPNGEFASGLEFADGRPKPSYGAFRMPLYLPKTSASAGQPLEVWGCVRPARFARAATHRPQRVRIEWRPLGAHAYRALKTVTLTDPDGYFDVHELFSQSGSVRLAWTYPHGPTIVSRTVAVTIR